MPGKLITREHFEERICIKLEAIRKPTRKQWHEAENEALAEFKEIYGDVDVPHWPRELVE